MARRATKNTYAFESVPGADTEIRRLVKAGTLVPETYRMESGSFEEVDAPTTTQTAFGSTGATPLTEPHNAASLDQPPSTESTSTTDSDELTGDALDARAEELGIDTSTGGSLSDGSMSADEKRAAIKEAESA